MVICIITSARHGLQSHNDPWLHKFLKTEKVVLVVVDKDGCAFESTLDSVSITLTAKSSCEALVKIKQHFDMEKILEAEILVPENNWKECKEFVSSIFPQVCNIIVKYSGSPLAPWDEINEDLNLRKPDGLCVVEENRKRLCAKIKCDFHHFYVAKANHGNQIWAYEQDAPESYDGIVTKTPHVTVYSPAADFNMLLLADPVVRACGAIHAGWKGILVGIVENTVSAMVTEYGCDPKNILVSLSVCCCEFGVEDSKKFLSISEKVVVRKAGWEKPHLDLRLAVRILLEKSGMLAENIDDGVSGSNSTPSIAVCMYQV